MVPLKN